MVAVKTGDSDRGPITNMEPRTKLVQVIQSNLTFEEASELGTQPWHSMENRADQWTCSVEGRRFIVEKEVYEQLCQAAK